MFKFNIQLFANEIKTTDVAPGISVDFASRIASNIKELQRILGITAPKPMSVGTAINLYKITRINNPAQVAEGVVIPLTEIKKEIDRTIQLPLNKWRKQSTAEAIQKSGRAVAINETDQKLEKLIRKEIKTSFFTTLASGTGTATAQNDGIQGAMADTWAKLAETFEDEDVTPVYFASQQDVAKYLGAKDVSMQTVFGWSYIENFLGLGNTFITPNLTAGTVIGTAAENLNMAYVPMSSGEVADAFDMTVDESGLVGIHHSIASDNASIESLIMSGVVFYPERIDGVVKCAITDSSTGSDSGSGSGSGTGTGTGTGA